MDNNSTLRIIISLLTGMFFSTTLLVSGTDAADPPCITPYFDAEASGTNIAIALTQAAQQISNGFVPQRSTVGDDRARRTAQSEYDERASTHVDWAHCALATSDTTLPVESQMIVCGYPPSASNEGDQAPQPPTTRDILLAAATVIHADGAGLRKRPDGVSYTNRFVPTIVSVTSPSQTHVINLLGRDITITLTATKYEWNWGDGTPNTVTTSPGLAWEKGIDPNNDPRLIRHYYTPPQGWRSMLDGPYPHENREITLTTTWSGSLTNPFTGDTQTINGLVTTTETTGPFPLSHLVINNTDTWEEKQGH